jgi:hypothetical protein
MEKPALMRETKTGLWPVQRLGAYQIQDRPRGKQNCPQVTRLLRLWNRTTASVVYKFGSPVHLEAFPMKPHPRIKPIISLEERLAEEAKHLRQEAKSLPFGPLREKLMRKARQSETGAHISAWIRSPGLQCPE